MDRFLKIFRRGDSDVQAKETALEIGQTNSSIQDQDNMKEGHSAVISDESSSKVSRKEQTEELEGQYSYSEAKLQAVKRLARRTNQLLYDNFMSYQESQEKEQGEEASPTSNVCSQQLPSFKEVAVKNQSQVVSGEHNSNGTLKHGSFDAGHKGIKVALVNFQEDKYSVQWEQQANSSPILQDTIYKLKDIKENAYQLYVRFLEDQFLQNIQAGDDEERKIIEESHQLAEINQQPRQNAVSAGKFFADEEVVKNGRSKSTERAVSLKQQSQQSQGCQSQQLKPSSLLESPVSSQREDRSSQNILEKETILDENSQRSEDLPTKKRFQNAEEYVVLKANGQQQHLLEGKAKDDEMEDEDGDKFYSTEQGLEEVVFENQEKYSALKAVQTTGQFGSDFKKDSHKEERNGVSDKTEEGLAKKLIPSEQSKEEKKNEEIEIEESFIPEKDSQIQEEVQGNTKGNGNIGSCENEGDESKDGLLGEVEEEQIRQEELTQERLKRQAKMTFYQDNSDNDEEEGEVEDKEQEEEEDKNAGADRRLHQLNNRNVSLSQPSGHAFVADTTAQQSSTNQKEIRSKHLFYSVNSQQDHFNPISHNKKHSSLRDEKTHEDDNESQFTNEVKYTLRAEERSPKNDGNAGFNERNHESEGDQKDSKNSEVEKVIAIEEQEEKDDDTCKNNKERNNNEEKLGKSKGQEVKGERQGKDKGSKRIEEREEGEEEDIEEEEEDKDEDNKDDDSEKVQTDKEEGEGEEEDDDDEEQEEEDEEQEDDDDDQEDEGEDYSDDGLQYYYCVPKKKISDEKEQSTADKNSSRITTTSRDPFTQALLDRSKPIQEVEFYPVKRRKNTKNQSRQDKLTTIKPFSKSQANNSKEQESCENNSIDSSSKQQGESQKVQKSKKQVLVARKLCISSMSLARRFVMSARKSAPITCNNRFSRTDEDEEEEEGSKEEEEEEDNEQEESEDEDENKFDEEDQSGYDL